MTEPTQPGTVDPDGKGATLDQDATLDPDSATLDPDGKGATLDPDGKGAT